MFRYVIPVYRANIPLEEQSDEDRLSPERHSLQPDLWMSSRQVIAGHTPVQMLSRFGIEPPEGGYG